MSCRCPLCGTGMGSGAAGCASCPLAFRCELLRCGSCGYEFPRGSKLVAWVKRLLRRPAAELAPHPATLDDVPRGATCVVAAVAGDARLRVKLAHLGLAEGASVRVDQRRPALVLRVGATRFAVEPDIARRVTVHAAGAA